MRIQIPLILFPIMSKMINVSEATSIAIHSLAVIAKFPEKKLNATEIADTTGFSKNHLSKIMQRLVKHGYLKSNRGPQGGFVLRKEAQEIKLLEIYNIIEGEFETEHCFMHTNSCPLEKCMFSDISVKMSKELKNYFENNTIADIIKK